MQWPVYVVSCGNHARFRMVGTFINEYNYDYTPAGARFLLQIKFWYSVNDTFLPINVVKYFKNGFQTGAVYEKENIFIF